MCKSNVSFPPMPIDCKPSKDAIVNCSAFIRGEETADHLLILLYKSETSPKKKPIAVF